MEAILDRITTILINITGEKELDITLHARLREDLELSSIDLMDLMVDAEEEFDILISDQDASRMDTVEDVVNYILNMDPE